MELQSIEKIDLSSLTDSEQADVLYDLIDNYRNNYCVEHEKRDYDKMRRIAQICEKSISDYFKQTSLEEIAQKKEGLEAIIDTVFFVYSCEYMYDVEVEILNIIAENDCMDKKLRIRAIESLFDPVLEVYIVNDALRYIKIMSELTGEEWDVVYASLDWRNKLEKQDGKQTTL